MHAGEPSPEQEQEQVGFLLAALQEGRHISGSGSRHGRAVEQPGQVW